MLQNCLVVNNTMRMDWNVYRVKDEKGETVEEKVISVVGEGVFVTLILFKDLRV